MKTLEQKHPIREEAARQNSRHRVTTFALAILLPIGWALLGAFSGNLWTQLGPITLIPWLLLGLVHFVLWWSAYPNENTVLALAVRNTDLENEKRNLESDLDSAEKWVFHSYAAHALRSMAVANVRNGIDSFPALKEALDDLLAPLYLAGGEILGFDGAERWSWTVYLYSNKLDRLIPVWREKSRNHPSSDVGRRWGRGQGHVGKAFVDGKIIVTGDASHPDVIQLCGAPAGLEADYDVEVYRSFASVPIGLFEENRLAYGVLVGTSDRKDRFDEDTGVLLWHYADSIGVLAALGDVDYDQLLHGRNVGGNDGEENKDAFEVKSSDTDRSDAESPNGSQNRK